MRAREPSGADLQIEAAFGHAPSLVLETDDDAAPFVRGVEFFDGRAWTGAFQHEAAWSGMCPPSGCRVRYTFALGEAASAIAQPDIAMAAGGLLIAPPSTWLVRPVGLPISATAENRYRFRVSGATFATGIAGSAGSFAARASEIETASFAVFGPFRRSAVHSGSSRVDLALAPAGLSLSEVEVRAWVERAVAGLAAYYGRFPTPRTLMVIVPGTGTETEGETLGDGGPSVLVRAAAGLTAARALDDWVVTHELLHVTLPSLDRNEAWLSEGIATYVEPIVRARARLVSSQRFWSDLYEGVPQGLPQPGDQGLERTHTWGRTYWGGALFCLVADVRIREKTRGLMSFDDVLRAVVATGADVEAHWSVDRFLDEGDRATGVPVLRQLYAEMALAPGGPDLDAFWRRLGVKRGAKGGVAFDEAAELAPIRRAIPVRNSTID